MNATDLLGLYVERHNRGVHQSDFTELGELLAPGAVMRVSGLPVGPFVGAAAIMEAFARMPSTDELIVLGDPREDGASIVATYGWKVAPSTLAGVLCLTVAEDHIQQIEVLVNPPHEDSAPPSSL